MDYAIIKVGNKQHRVRDGERLVVERVATAAGETFEPIVLLGDEKVTATVVAHERGPKLIIGKYKRRTGYKRHNGFRAAISRVEITIGAGTNREAAKRQRAPKAETPAAPETSQTPEAVEVVEAAAADVVPVEGAPVEVAPADAGGAPSGYESMTVAQINAAAKEWSHEELEAALGYERAHGARKGAISALEGALKKDPDEASETEEEAE